MALPKMMLCRGHNNPMLKCSGNKKIDEFYKSRSDFAYFPEGFNPDKEDGRVPYCKQCVQKIFEYYYENGSGSALDCAVYYTCQKLDIPFITELYNEILNEKRTNDEFKNMTRNYMGKYITALNKGKTKYGGKIDFSYSDSDLSEIDQKIEKREMDKKELERFQLDWGLQEDDEDYALLEYDFYELTDGISLTKPQEMLYRDLCLARLAKRKAEKKNDDVVIQKSQGRILTLMKTLRIDNFSENKELSVVERMLETRIAIQEKDKPTFYYEGENVNKNDDFLGRGKYFYDHIYRSLKNQWSKNKLYKIFSKEEDKLTDEDYEKIMENGSDRKED